MELEWLGALFIFLFAFSIVGSITPSIRNLAIRLEVIDRPIETHKTHSLPVPYLGGISIIFGVLTTTFVTILISGNFRLLGLASTVLVPAIFMGMVGLFDDIKSLSPWPRFVAQNTVGLGIASVLVSTNTLGAPLGNQLYDLLISVFWIVGITNSINFFDNVDGGASGTVAISSMFLFFLAFQDGQYFLAALSIVLSGATAGFLIWNKDPARIYMGDAGALFLGVLIASLTLRFDPNTTDKLASFLIPVLLLAVPILDTTVVVISRLRRGISPFRGGQDHLSHRLINSFFTKRQAVILLWLLTLVFCFIAIFISLIPPYLEQKMAILSLLMWFLCLVVFSKLSFPEKS